MSCWKTCKLLQPISSRTSCSCKWKPSVHVAVQTSLTCLWVNENWDFNRSDLRSGWQDTPCWKCNNIIQFGPVNTFTAVRSVSCIYLAGITLWACTVWPTTWYRNKEKRRCAEGAGVMYVFPQHTVGSSYAPFKLPSRGLLFWLAPISVVSWSAHLALLH